MKTPFLVSGRSHQLLKIKESRNQQSNYISFVNNNICYKSALLTFSGKILTYSYISTFKHVYSFCVGFSKPVWKSLLNVYRYNFLCKFRHCMKSFWPLTAVWTDEIERNDITNDITQ